MGKWPVLTFIKEEIQMTNRHLMKYSIPLKREMQVKSTMKCHFTLIKQLLSKIWKTVTVEDSMVKAEPLSTCSNSVSQHSQIQREQFSGTKSRIYMQSRNPTISHVSILKSVPPRDICIPMPTAALFVITSSRKST